MPAPVVYILFMGSQVRFFGRWLLPISPFVALLAGVGALAIATWVLRSPVKARRPAALAVLFVIVCAQGMVYSTHSTLLLGRDDTRTQARDWMFENVPPGVKIVLEPIVPSSWIQPIGKNEKQGRFGGDQWVKYPVGKSQIDPKTGAFTPDGKAVLVSVEDFERVLRPDLINTYARGGFCLVVVGSTQRGRAEAEPIEVPDALRYYRDLEANSSVVARFSPFDDPKDPVPFSFDWSFIYFPLKYERPARRSRSTGSAGSAARWQRTALLARLTGVAAEIAKRARSRSPPSRAVPRPPAGPTAAWPALRATRRRARRAASPRPPRRRAGRPVTAGHDGPPLVRRSHTPRARVPRLGRVSIDDTDRSHLARAVELAELGRGSVHRIRWSGASSSVPTARSSRRAGTPGTAGPTRRRPRSPRRGRPRAAPRRTSRSSRARTPARPPCSVALADAGVARVVVASDDPSEKASGRGLGYLRDEGSPSEVLPADDEIAKSARLLNQPFRKHSRTGLPWILHKAAATLDGKIASRTGDSKWVTCDESRERGHRWRAALDAVVVGIGTALADDPQLTAASPEWSNSRAESFSIRRLVCLSIPSSCKRPPRSPSPSWCRALRPAGRSRPSRARGRR